MPVSCITLLQAIQASLPMIRISNATVSRITYKNRPSIKNEVEQAKCFEFSLEQSNDRGGRELIQPVIKSNLSPEGIAFLSSLSSTGDRFVTFPSPSIVGLLFVPSLLSPISYELYPIPT